MNAMFKKGMLASVLAVAASSAMAASSVDIQITGKIVPASCSPAFVSGGGIVDFGTMKAADLNSTSHTALAEIKMVPVSITCESPTRIAMQFTDVRESSAPTDTIMDKGFTGNFSSTPKYTFGLGMYNDKKIGAYALGIKSTAGAITNDAGTQLYPIVSSDSGAGWGTSIMDEGYMQIVSDKSEIYSFSTTAGEYTPSAQTKINFSVEVSAMINPTNDLNITDEATLDGLTTLELIYI